MFLYNVRIAVKSLRRSPVLSLLLLVAIALGTGVATTFSAVRHAFARDPIPSKSDVLRNVRLDAWDPTAPFPNDKSPGAPPPQITYQDMIGITRSDIPVRQAAMFRSETYVFPPEGGGMRPFREPLRLTSRDFFAMFEVPFKFGGAWTKDDDANASRVVVIGAELNEKLFGGANSVGKTLRAHEEDFTIVGVLDAWRPGIKFYDVTGRATDSPEELFAPLSLVLPLEIPSAGEVWSWGPTPAPGFANALASEMTFLQMWVELPNADAERAYHSFLDAYALEQRKRGRFQRPLNNRVTSIPDLLEEMKVVPPAASAMMMVSLLFLAVCCVNLIGILLGKFLARAPEVGVRRALGARRIDIFLQHIVECELLGVCGGALGLLISVGGVAAMNAYMKIAAERSDLFRLDTPMLLLSIGLALLAGLVAGVYPAYRICKASPASHLKVG